MLAFALALGGLLLAAAPLYPTYAHQPTRLFGISPALDQHLAGLVMVAEQVASLTMCAVFLLPALRKQAALKRVPAVGRAPLIPRVTLPGDLRITRVEPAYRSGSEGERGLGIVPSSRGGSHA